jgi:hypothetical protein
MNSEKYPVGVAAAAQRGWIKVLEILEGQPKLATYWDPSKSLLCSPYCSSIPVAPDRRMLGSVEFNAVGYLLLAVHACVHVTSNDVTARIV